MTTLESWLESHGLGALHERFAASDIDLDVLAELSDDDLRELGLTLGQRRRLLKAIKAVETATPVPDPTAAGVPPDRAERRQLTVMFADLADSTALAARFDPEETRHFIRTYQDTVAGEITRVEGHVAKFLGDGILAYFGWPAAHEDEVERALHAGLAVARSVGRLQAAGRPLGARIGIATGLVVVGDLIGEGAAREESVVGETPNLAARLQAIAEPGQVVVSEQTRRLAEGLFDFTALPPRALKGFNDPVAAFVVNGAKESTSRFDTRSRLQLAPLVGRDQELGLLRERWSQAVAAEGQCLLLAGEAGIGKSRLARALMDMIASERRYEIRWQCSPYHRDSALWPVIQQLGFAARFEADDSVETKLDKLESLLGQAVDDARQAAPLLASLLGIEAEARYGRLEIMPQAQRARTLAALTGQLLGLARKRPVLCVIEDVHWIDPTTLELVETALDRIGKARVLILLTSRPDGQPPLAGHPHMTRLTLNRLERSAVEAITARLAGARRLPPSRLEEIVARATGCRCSSRS